MTQFYDEITGILPDLKIKSNEPMKNHTTFRIGGNADYYCSPEKKELPVLLKTAQLYNIPVTIIGNGSNLLVQDAGIRGLVIEIGAGMNRIEISKTRLLAGAGTLLSAAAGAAAAAGLGGMEFAAGIPGSVGGAVTMNAGAYGGEMKDILKSVKVITLSGEEKTLTNEALDLSYRHSCISDAGYIVTEALLELHPAEEHDIRSKMAELRSLRVEKQPLEYPSAGSTFKRPEGYFAGKLIMDAGLRGYSVGGAQISEKHCGFVVNRGNATAADVIQLIEEVQTRVKEAFGVALEPEVKILGQKQTGDGVQA